MIVSFVLDIVAGIEWRRILWAWAHTDTDPRTNIADTDTKHFLKCTKDYVFRFFFSSFIFFVSISIFYCWKTFISSFCSYRSHLTTTVAHEDEKWILQTPQSISNVCTENFLTFFFQNKSSDGTVSRRPQSTVCTLECVRFRFYE